MYICFYFSSVARSIKGFVLQQIYIFMKTKSKVIEKEAVNIECILVVGMLLDFLQSYVDCFNSVSTHKPQIPFN